MEPAFWDSSSLVPLCVQQESTPTAEALSEQYSMFIWWATPVEVLGAFTRLIRMRQLTPNQEVQARVALDEFRARWREVRPTEEIRNQAEYLLGRFPLRSADSLQLAATLAWCQGRPKGRAFISGDKQLLDAARQLGFQALPT
jgi:predicted nucleic acid-binding protein